MGYFSYHDHHLELAKSLINKKVISDLCFKAIPCNYQNLLCYDINAVPGT